MGRVMENKEKECMEVMIDRLASRHIAKLLDRLGDTVAPVQVSEIKRQMRFFADDVKQVINKEIRAHEEINGNI